MTAKRNKKSNEKEKEPTSTKNKMREVGRIGGIVGRMAWDRVHDLCPKPKTIAIKQNALPNQRFRRPLKSLRSQFPFSPISLGEEGGVENFVRTAGPSVLQ